MKKFLFIASATLSAIAAFSAAHPAFAGTNWSVNVGVGGIYPPAVYAPVPAPYYAPPPVVAPVPVYVQPPYPQPIYVRPYVYGGSYYPAPRYIAPPPVYYRGYHHHHGYRR
jgi:hypothetical protein